MIVITAGRIRPVIFWEFLDATASELSLLTVAHVGLMFSLIFIILALPRCVFRPTDVYLFGYLGVDSTRALMLHSVCLLQLSYSWQIQGS